MNKQQKETIVEELDFRYGCLEYAKKSEAYNLPAELACYNGLTRMLELCGYDWTRMDGKHKIFNK